MSNTRRLFAVVNPFDSKPSFAIPVFGDSGNTYIAKVGDGGKIYEFEPIVVPRRGVVRLDSSKFGTIGEPALFGFVFADGDCVVGAKAELQQMLRTRLDEFAALPFLQIDIAEFLQDEAVRAAAESRATQLLARENPENVTRWIQALRRAVPGVSIRLDRKSVV